MSKAIFLGEKMVQEGEKDADIVVKAMLACLALEPMANVEYVKAVHGLTMKDVDRLDAPALVAIAVRIGKTRLSDNFVVD